jgi:hypothetical protein
LTQAIGGGAGYGKEQERSEEAMKSVLAEKSKTFTPDRKFAVRSQLHIRG